MVGLNQNCLFRVENSEVVIKDLDVKLLCDKIKKVANFFGFSHLPAPYRICLSFCDEKKMKKKILEQGLDLPSFICAYTFGINEIYILEYNLVQKYFSKEAYISIIVHEFVHVFQMYYSCVVPETCIWFYESIACYMAGQSKFVSLEKNINWDTFVNSFYINLDCYGIAYELGRKIFESYDKESILKIIKTPIKFIGQIKELYMSIQS